MIEKDKMKFTQSILKGVAPKTKGTSLEKRKTRCLSLAEKAKLYHDQIFEKFHNQEQTFWGDEHEAYLEKLHEVRDLMNNEVMHKKQGCLVSEELHIMNGNISILAKEAELFKKMHLGKKGMQNLYNKVLTGLEQDSHFPRVDEYLKKMHQIHKSVTEESDSGICKKIMKRSAQFFDQFHQGICHRISRTEEEIYTMRIERADDLHYACVRSKPGSQRELTAKLEAIDLVLHTHLEPMLELELSKEQRENLELIIKNYNEAFDFLNTYELPSLLP